MADVRRQLARELFERAHRAQLQGDLELAVDLYRKSIAMHPTAEAHTFLGWTYRLQDRIADAVAECKKAIEVDPTLGNPYNDIGSYLIELGEWDEAVSWLERAIGSERYEQYHYPWYNLGRVYLHREMYNKARECFARALEYEPGYEPAREALRKLRILVQ